MMDWKNIILLIVAGLNLGSALMVYFLNPKNRINIYYSAFVFWVSVWIFGVALFRSMETKTGVHLIIYTYYAAGGLIPIFFYLFSIYFPYQHELLTLKKRIFTGLGILAILIVTLPPFLVDDVILAPPNNVVILDLIGHTIYIIIFFFFAVPAFINLIGKLRKSDGIFRVQLKCVIYGSGVAYFFGILFDLFYPLFGDYSMVWLGPYFTVVMLIFLDYLIFFYSRK